MENWWQLYEERLPTTDRNEKIYIEDITGCTPLFLCPLLKFGHKDFKDVKLEFLSSPELDAIPNQVWQFAKSKKESLSGLRWKR
jgi:hypothetical protein